MGLLKLKTIGSINHIFEDSFKEKYSEKFANYGEDSYCLALTDYKNHIINFVTFTLDEFFVETSNVECEFDSSLNDLSELITSLKYGVDVFKPYDNGEDYTISYLSDISFRFFLNLGFLNTNQILNKPLKIIFPKFKELSLFEIYNNSYNLNRMNNFILFFNEELLFDANYRLSRYKDYLVQMVDAISDFHYMKRIQHIFNESTTPLIIIQEGMVVEVNDAYLELFGFKKEDIVGKPYNFSTKNSLNMSLSERKDRLCQKLS